MTILHHSRFVAWVLMGVLLSLGSGCVKIDATITMERDGSGSLRTICGMSTHVIKQAELAREMARSLDLAAGITNSVLPDVDIPYLYDEAALRAKFGVMARDGITLESLKLREQGGWNYVDFNLKFKNMESLFRQPLFRNCGVVYKRLDERTGKLTITPPPVGASPDTAGLTVQENLNKLTPFLNGFRVVVRVSVPGEIRNTNSQISDSHRATWEWDFDKDSQALARLNRERMILIFDAADVRGKDFDKPADPVLLNEK